MKRAARDGQLRALVERHCGARVVALEPISTAFEDRVVCRARFANRAPVTLRAFTGQVREWLLAQVAALDYLEEQSFPAPRVVRALGGQAVPSHEGWAGLILTFVDGTDAGFSPAAPGAIAELAAVLQALPANDPLGLGSSRLAPASELTRLLPRLEQAGERVPSLARAFYRGAVETLRKLETPPPVALLHGDFSPSNGVRTPDGEIVMVDWEGAG